MSRILGMKPFQDWIYRGNPEYAIFAVKAPIEQVGQALVDKCGIRDWQKQVQSEKSLCDSVPYGKDFRAPMLQPVDNPWTVVYWYVGGWTPTEDLCKKLSHFLQTSVLSLSEEDTSGAIGYDLYDRGKKTESGGWCPGEDLFFESDSREEPELDDFESPEQEVMNQFFNEAFVNAGAYIPGWNINVSDPSLQRVDLIQLP